MMKSMLLQIVLLLACAPGAPDGQDALGAGSKKPRTPDDYKPRTLKAIAAASEAEGGRDKDAAEVVLGDLFPSRVRVTYRGSARPLPQSRKDVIARWARQYAGDPTHYTAPYETEMLFDEDGTGHWLAVNKRLLPRFEKELKEGEAIDLYAIRLGGVRTEGKWEWVLLVESFDKP
jgi:hypothetical protein